MVMSTVSYEYNTENLISVLVEVTTYCNMKCTGCIRTIKNNQDNWANHHLSVDDFKKMVFSLPQADEIVTQGIGEPTMHPQLPEMIKIAHDSGKFNKITLTSNALARKPEYYQQLFDAGLTRLYISVDSFDPELANQLREGTDIDKLRENISVLTRLYPGLIAIRTVVSSLNIESVPVILSELNDLGSLMVFFHPYDDIGDPTGVMTLEERVDFDQYISDIENDYENLEVRANGFIPGDDICIHPWKIPAITADGYLVPCCRVMDKDIFSLGNVIKKPFDEVWNSTETNNMRKDFLEKSPDYCEGCTRHKMRI